MREALQEEELGETTYNNLISAHQEFEAAVKHVPKKPKWCKRSLWEDDNVLELRQALKKAHQAIRQSNDQEIDFAGYVSLKQQLKDAYICQKTKEITDASHQNKPRLVWQVVNKISGRKNGNKGKIRANSPKERLQQWCQHFQELLGQPPNISDVAIEPIVDDQLPINTEPFTMAELTTVIKTMSLNQAAGYDNIPAEVWKSGALNDMTTSHRSKCVPQILGSLRIHIFMLLFSFIINAYRLFADVVACRRGTKTL